MDVAVIDQNLRLNAIPKEADIVWRDASQAPFVTYGAWQSVPRYLRLPEAVATAASEGVVELNGHTAGVRIRFCTDSPYVAVRAEWSVLSRMSHMPPSGISGLDLYALKDDKQIFQGALIPPLDAKHGFEALLYTSGEMTEYVLNLPLYNRVDRLVIGTKDGASFEQPMPYANPLPVVFYGSSITQGGCASRPGNSYPNFLSRWLNMDYLNLGFSGSARAEDAIVEYMAGLPMAAFVSDYDHNAPDAAYLEKTHLRMYQMIREMQPELPYVIISRPDFKPGDEVLKEIILATYRYALDHGDKNVYFIDGSMLFGEADGDACTVDGCHPNDLGFYRMARGMEPVLRKVLESGSVHL